MSAHVEEHFAGSNKLFISIWVWLVVLTLIEIFLAYRPMSILLMLTILLGLSIIKAALIVAYFMHLKFERLSLILTIVPMLVSVSVCCLCFSLTASGRRACVTNLKKYRPRLHRRGTLMSVLRETTLLLVLASIVVLVVLGDTAFGQCSMCRTALAGSNNAFIRNFNIGVLVLLVPPVTIFCSIFLVLGEVSFSLQSGVSSRSLSAKILTETTTSTGD